MVFLFYPQKAIALALLYYHAEQALDDCADHTGRLQYRV